MKKKRYHSQSQKIIIPLIALIILGTGATSVSAISIRSGKKLSSEERQILQGARELLRTEHRESVRELLEDAGIEWSHDKTEYHKRHRTHFNNLSEEQQEIVRALGNDRGAIRAYLEEEGLK